MRSRVALFMILFAAGSFVLPSVVHAQSIPFFGPIIPESAGTCALGWGAVIVVINRIISLSITLAIVFVAPIMIAYAGFLLVINPANPGGKEKAKDILLNTVVGIIIALAGWLIVDAVMAVLYNSTTPVSDGSVLQTWSSIISSDGLDYCLVQASSLQTLNQAPVTGISAYGSYSPGGSCTVPAAGPCTLQNLQNSCFGSTANSAAEVCAYESSGNPANLSKSDLTADGYSYSIGLFQINITNSFNQQVDGKSCSQAFTQPCQNSGGYQNVQPNGLCSSRVADQTLYKDCVAAAEDPASNITQACRLSNNGTNWNPWRNTAAACRL